MFKRLRQWWDRRSAMSEFRCAFWCPKCGEELHYHARRVWDEPREAGVLAATCDCGHVSRWFWGAPVPLLLSEDSPRECHPPGYAPIPPPSAGECEKCGGNPCDCHYDAESRRDR